MAIAFKRESGILTASLADLYTPGAGLTSVVFSAVFTNIGSVNYELTVEIEDNAAGTFRDLVTALVIPPNEAFELTKVALEPNDSLRAAANVTSVIEYNISILEDPFNVV